MDPAKPSWTELRIHADRQNHDRILLMAVAPFLHSLKREANVTRAYFLREPAFTPIMLRLRFEKCPECTTDLAERLNSHLCTVNELVRDVEDECHAEFIGHRELLSGPSAGALMDDFFSETTPFLLNLIATQDRMRVASDLMIVHPLAINSCIFAKSRGLPFPNTFLSFRSHADGFFIMARVPSIAQREFDRRYRTIAATLISRVKAIASQFSQSHHLASPTAKTWFDFVSLYVQRVLAELNSGRLTVRVDSEGYIGDEHDLGTSTFHQAIQESVEYRTFMNTNNEFLALRIMLSLLYWTLSRLGVGLIERFWLCHAVSRAYEEAYEVDPTTVIRDIIESFAASP